MRRSFLLIALLFVPALVWAWLDHSVWPWDPAWYGEVSVELNAALLRSFPEWLRMLPAALPDRAPGLIWVGQFFVPLGGTFGLLLLTVLLQGASTWVLYRALAALFENELSALASVVFVCSAPLFAGMSQSYYTEPFQGFGIALFLYFLARAGKRPLWRSMLLLGIAALVATFGRITAGLYLACPALLFAALCLERRAELRTRPRLDRTGLLLAAAFAAGMLIFGAWLLISYKAVFAHAAASAIGSVSELYGTRAGFGPKLWLWMRSFDRELLGPVMRVAFMAALLLAVPRRKPARWADRVAFACMAGIGLTLVVLSFTVNEYGRFLFGLYPLAAVAACWALTRLNRRGVSIAYLCAALAQFGLVHAQAFGALEPGASSYVHAIDRTGERLRLVKRAVAATCTPEHAGRLFIAGQDTPEFSGNSLSFYSSLANARAGFKCYYDRPGPVDEDAVWKSAAARHAAGFLFLKKEAPRDAFNRASGGLLKLALSARQLRVQAVAGAPGLLLFVPAYEPNWRIRSALFPLRSGVWTDVAGRTAWRVHASRRRGGPQTVIEFTRPLPPDAALSGMVEAADARCPGVELELTAAGAGSRQTLLPLPRPLAGRTFTARLGNSPGDTLTIRVQSLDRRADNVNYCSLLIRDVRIVAGAPQWTTGAP